MLAAVQVGQNHLHCAMNVEGQDTPHIDVQSTNIAETTGQKECTVENAFLQVVRAGLASAVTATRDLAMMHALRAKHREKVNT